MIPKKSTISPENVEKTGENVLFLMRVKVMCVVLKGGFFIIEKKIKVKERLERVMKCKIFKKLLAALMVSSMTISLGAYAGTEVMADESDPITMFAVINGADYQLEDCLAFQVSCENAGITFEISSCLPADSTTKTSLLMASGKYQDVFFKPGFSSATLAKYGSQGALIPLNDLIREYAPNLTAILDERDLWQYLMDVDGNIWSLPEIGSSTLDASPMWINKTWLENLGLEEPTNLEELYEVLKAFKEQDANGNGDPDDEIPLSFNLSKGVEYLLSYYGMNFDSWSLTAYDSENESISYIPTSETYKEMLAYVAKLYEEGILYKNSFTQTTEQETAFAQSGDVLGAFFSTAAFTTVGREQDENYVVVMPFTEGTWSMTSGVSVGALCITDSCEHPEEVIAWADQFYTEEGGILAWMGVEGITYEMNEDGTWEWLGDNIAVTRAAETIQGSKHHPSISPELFSKTSDPDENYMNEEKDKIIAVAGAVRPENFLDDADMTTLVNVVTELNNYIEQYSANVIIGNMDLESTWDEYLNTMEAMGASRVSELYTKGLENSPVK